MTPFLKILLRFPQNSSGETLKLLNVPPMPAPMKPVTVEDQFSRLAQHNPFSDLDQIAEQLRPLGQLRLTQLSTDSLQSHIVLAIFDHVRITFTEFSCPIHIGGEKPRDVITFGLDLTLDSPGIISHNCKLSSNTIADFNPSLEFNSILPPDVKRATVQIHRNTLEEYLRVMGRFDLDEQFWANNFVPGSATLSSLRLYLNQILYLVLHKASCLQHPHSKQQVEKDVISLLINSLPAPKVNVLQSLPLLTRSQLVKQAEDYMMTHLDQPLTLKDVCDALHVSRRPLFYGFQEMFGTSPMEYLKAKRLQSTRRMLKVANPKTTSVRAISQKFGFWSTGHFARDYKAMFGELPVETLNRCS
jgi:AraC family transcriptional regulator, ethanolamine operon transcriptional activator